MENYSVLVIGVSTQIGLEIIRSLGKKGIRVYAADCNSEAIGFYSKYLKKKFVIPFSPESSFISAIFRILDSHSHIKCIFAISERNITLLNKYRTELEEKTQLMFPSQDVMDFALDKKKTFIVAQKLNIPTPDTVFIDNFEEIKRAKDMEYPVVIKPAVRDFLDPSQQAHDFRVRYINSYKELVEVMKFYKNIGRYPMIQNCCKGEEIGFSAIMTKGKAVACFQYLNFHLSPVRGGVPVLRRSIPISPKLKEYTIKILREINWEGVAELDYIKDLKDGELKLLEINGRFWGGTPLPSRAGLPFPYILFKALVEKKKFYTEEYKTDIKCCLLGGETKRLLEILNAPNGYFGFSKKRAIKEYISLFIDPKSHFDVHTYHDPMPGILDAWFMVRKGLRSLVSNFLS